jgi:excisionase family DNA binding protein
VSAVPLPSGRLDNLNALLSRSDLAPRREVGGDRESRARVTAELLGLSPATLLRRWRAGELPGYRLGSNVLRFSPSDVTAWLEARRQVEPKEPA